MNLPVLGWKEEADLPAWGIERLRVKLDTGARTSALHVRDVTTVDHHILAGRRLPVVRFHIPLSRKARGRLVEATAPVLGYKSVRDTSATAKRRPVVATRLVCGPIDHEILLTLTDRGGMIFRMLLGRHAIAGRAVVDPSIGYTTRAGRSRAATTGRA